MSRHSYSPRGDVNKTPLRCLVSSKQCRLQVHNRTTYNRKISSCSPVNKTRTGLSRRLWTVTLTWTCSKIKSNIRLVSAFPLVMMSCRDDLDGGSLALAGSRDDHWGLTSLDSLLLVAAVKSVFIYYYFVFPYPLWTSRRPSFFFHQAFHIQTSITIGHLSLLLITWPALI